MERLVFWALIKYIFKADLQKDEISCAKYFNSVHLKTIELKCSRKIQDKKSSGLKINPIQGRVFWIFERKRVLFGPCQKNHYKNCLLHLNHFKLGTKHLWNLTKIILILVRWPKWWCQHNFWWRHHSTTNFLSFKLIPCL